MSVPKNINSVDPSAIAHEVERLRRENQDLWTAMTQLQVEVGRLRGRIENLETQGGSP